MHPVAEDRFRIGGIGEVVVTASSPSAARSVSIRAWRSTVNGLSPGQSRSTISAPGSRPHDWTVRSRPPAARLLVSGARIFSTLNPALMRARHGCDASTKSYDGVPLPDSADDVVEQELVIEAVEHEDRRLLRHGIAGLGISGSFPSPTRGSDRAPRSARRARARMRLRGAPPASSASRPSPGRSAGVRARRRRTGS